MQTVFLGKVSLETSNWLICTVGKISADAQKAIFQYLLLRPGQSFRQSVMEEDLCLCRWAAAWALKCLSEAGSCDRVVGKTGAVRYRWTASCKAFRVSGQLPNIRSVSWPVAEGALIRI